MPRGSRHEEAGLLVEDGGRLSLRRDEGGTWRIDPNWRSRQAYRLAGRRVRIVGVRDGFDLLAIETIEQV